VSHRPAPLVLCYHAVSDNWEDWLAVPERDFERQLRLLARGRRPGTAADAAAGRRVLHVTFDDAYASVLHALPLLEGLRLPATVFACAGYGDGRPLEISELSGGRFDAEGLATLSWDELRGLRERGVEIGSHTVTHAHLTQLTDTALERELAASRERIGDELGRPCRYLAYPYGEQDGRVRAAAGRAGYDAAFGLPGIPGDRYALPRVGIYRWNALWRVALKAATRSWRADRSA